MTEILVGWSCKYLRTSFRVPNTWTQELEFGTYARGPQLSLSPTQHANKSPPKRALSWVMPSEVSRQRLSLACAWAAFANGRRKWFAQGYSG